MAGVRKAIGASAWLLLAGTLLVLARPAFGQSISKLRDLDFGGCDNVGGSTYTVSPTATQGVSVCFGAQSAQFTISGTPGTRVRVRLASNSVTLVNGAATLTASLNPSVAGGPTCLGSGSITVFVGGSVQLPGAGVAVPGVFQVFTDISASTVGGSCPTVP